jgi:hypothetical protein
MPSMRLRLALALCGFSLATSPHANGQNADAKSPVAKPLELHVDTVPIKIPEIPKSVEEMEIIHITPNPQPGSTPPEAEHAIDPRCAALTPQQRSQTAGCH